MLAKSSLEVKDGHSWRRRNYKIPAFIHGRVSLSNISICLPTAWMHLIIKTIVINPIVATGLLAGAIGLILAVE